MSRSRLPNPAFDSNVGLRADVALVQVSPPDAQRLCNVDFEKDVAFIAVAGPRENEEIVGTGAYLLNP